jgi:hypothetical protein
MSTSDKNNGAVLSFEIVVGRIFFGAELDVRTSY